MPDIANSTIESLVERVTSKSNGDLAAMLGDPDIGGAFHGAPKEISNHSEKWPIIDTESGETREIPVMYLTKTLKKRRDGKPAFATIDPETGQPNMPVPEYVVGSLKCFLHPEHPEREWLASIGIGKHIICGDHQTKPAGSFRTEYDRDWHEEKKHPHSFKIRADAMARRKEDEANDRQERTIAAMLAMAGGKTKATFDCDECERFFDSAQGLTLHKSRDHK